MTSPLPLSAVIITRNEADRLGRCLASVRDVCSEILVLDCGSDDGTVALAQSFGARVEHQDWLGFAEQKNEAIRRATQPWLLLMDADEWLADGSEAFVDARTGALIDRWRPTDRLPQALRHILQ